MSTNSSFELKEFIVHDCIHTTQFIIIDLVFFDKDGQLQLLESFDILLDIIEDLDGSIANNGCCPSSRASSPSVTSNTSLLKSKLTELQYDNTRLKIDLLNR